MIDIARSHESRGPISVSDSLQRKKMRVKFANKEITESANQSITTRHRSK